MFKIKLFKENKKEIEIVQIRDDNGDYYQDSVVNLTPLYEEVEVSADDFNFYNAIEAFVEKIQCGSGEWSDFLYEEDYYLEELEGLKTFFEKNIQKMLNVKDFEKISAETKIEFLSILNKIENIIEEEEEL